MPTVYDYFTLSNYTSFVITIKPSMQYQVFQIISRAISKKNKKQNWNRKVRAVLHRTQKEKNEVL